MGYLNILKLYFELSIPLLSMSFCTAILVVALGITLSIHNLSQSTGGVILPVQVKNKQCSEIKIALLNKRVRVGLKERVTFVQSTEGDGRMIQVDILRGKLSQANLQPVKIPLNGNLPDMF